MVPLYYTMTANQAMFLSICDNDFKLGVVDFDGTETATKLFDILCTVGARDDKS